MKNFVKLIEQVHAERFSVVTSRLITKKIPVAFMSIAPIEPSVQLVKNFRAQGLNVSTLFVTDNTPPVNLEFKVVHVNDAAQLQPQLEYVFVSNFESAAFAKKFLGKSKVLFPNPTRSIDSERVYEIFMTHLDELREVYESLIDEQSKKTFRGYWLGNVCGQICEIVSADTPHYFLTGFNPKAGDILIDGGCYDGWNASQFAGLGCKVYSFEMNKTNFDLTVKVAEEKNFVLENLGLGAYPHESRYINAHSASRLDASGNDTATITTLDKYVCEKNLPRVDYIKLDVEGAELDVLRGAAMTISCFKPRLALSAYHKLDDFWTLMNFVKAIRPDYEFAMRQYPVAYGDLPHAFDGGLKELFTSFGLECVYSNYNECVLFAR